MASHLSTYINFSGQAREALTFYHSVLGGELSVVTYADFQASDDPADAHKLMHGSITEQLARAPWGDTYGSFVDRFGVSWMVNIDGSGTQA